MNYYKKNYPYTLVNLKGLLNQNENPQVRRKLIELFFKLTRTIVEV